MQSALVRRPQVSFFPMVLLRAFSHFQQQRRPYFKEAEAFSTLAITEPVNSITTMPADSLGLWCVPLRPPQPAGAAMACLCRCWSASSTAIRPGLGTSSPGAWPLPQVSFTVHTQRWHFRVHDMWRASIHCFLIIMCACAEPANA